MGAEEELLKWLAQYDDIQENGTPPPWIRCTDFPSHLWNKLMGFVDLPRKVIKSKRAIRGPVKVPLGEGQKDGRTRCILCCEKCIKNVCTPVRTDTEERIRHGRKTTKYCPACGVVICKHCWNVFHSKDITLPACSKFHHMLAVQTRSDMRTTEVTAEGTAGDNFIVRRRQVSP